MQKAVKAAIRKPAEPSGSKGFDYSKALPLIYAAKRLREADLPRKARGPLVGIVHVIADAMDGETGTCFLSRATIAERSGQSKDTVRRYLPLVLQDGVLPLFVRSFPGETRGYRHRCPRFTLIRSPLVFAASREQLRKQIGELYKPGPLDLDADRLRDEFLARKAALDASLVRGQLNEAEHRKQLGKLERDYAPRMRGRE